MKKIIIIVVFVMAAATGRAQSNEAQQLLLNWEKLNMLKNILKNMEDGYRVLSKGYKAVRDVSQGNFSLHQVFLDALWQVSPTVRKYWKTGEIISQQFSLVREYKIAYQRFSRDPNFDPEYLSYLTDVYSNLLDLGAKDLEELANVITANKLRMSDDERLAAIDAIYLRSEDKLLFLRHFNSETSLLALQWAKERNDTKTLRNIYGIK